MPFTDSKMTAEIFKQENGYTIDGAWYPRVTKIVSIKAKPMLFKFYDKVGGYEKGQAIAQKSAEEGTLVHEIVQAAMLGKETEIPDNIRPSYDAFLDFAIFKKIKTQAEFIERRFTHPLHRYAGTIDVLAEIDGKFGVLDIKTSQSIYRDYNLQTAAYIDALQRDFENLETRWILRIDQVQHCARCGGLRRFKGGQESLRAGTAPYRVFYGCKPHDWGKTEGEIELQEFPSWKNDLEAFLGAKKLWEWENEDWLKKINYI